jgi:hypothetical protein
VSFAQYVWHDRAESVIVGTTLEPGVLKSCFSYHVKVTGVAQLVPLYPAEHTHTPVVESHVPLPEQLSGQGVGVDMGVAQLVPLYPAEHTHAPVVKSHVPLPEQLSGHVFTALSLDGNNNNTPPTTDIANKIIKKYKRIFEIILFK